MFFIFLLAKLDFSSPACSGRQEAACEKFWQFEDFSTYPIFQKILHKGNNLLNISYSDKALRIFTCYPRKHVKFFNFNEISYNIDYFGPSFKWQTTSPKLYSSNELQHYLPTSNGDTNSKIFNFSRFHGKNRTNINDYQTTRRKHTKKGNKFFEYLNFAKIYFIEILLIIVSTSYLIQDMILKTQNPHFIETINFFYVELFYRFQTNITKRVINIFKINTQNIKLFTKIIFDKLKISDKTLNSTVFTIMFTTLLMRLNGPHKYRKPERKHKNFGAHDNLISLFTKTNNISSATSCMSARIIAFIISAIIMALIDTLVKEIRKPITNNSSEDEDEEETNETMTYNMQEYNTRKHTNHDYRRYNRRNKNNNPNDPFENGEPSIIFVPFYGGNTELHTFKIRFSIDDRTDEEEYDELTTKIMIYKSFRHK